MSEYVHRPESAEHEPHNGAELLHDAITAVLLEHGRRESDGVYYEFDIDNDQYVLVTNYLTAAAHRLHRISDADPGQIQGLEQGEALISATVRNRHGKPSQNYLICKPGDVRRHTIVADIVGEDVLDSLDQDAYAILEVGRAAAVTISPHRLQQLLPYIK